MAQKSRIAVTPGDGIGPEVVAEAVRCLETLRAVHHLELEWTRFPWPSHAWHEEHSESMPDDALEQLKAYDAILLGALGDPGPIDDPKRYLLPDSISLAPLLDMRKGFDQWVCERPARLLPGARQYLADERANTAREREQKEYYRRECDELMATINEQALIASFIASGHDSATTTTPATPPALPSGTSASTRSTRRRSPTRKRKPPTPRGS